MPAAATRADALRAIYSSAEVKHLKAVGAFPGVAVNAAGGRNGPGVGMLRFYEGNKAAYRAPGSDTFGPQIALAADGSFVIEDGEDRHKFLRITAYTAFLPPGPQAAQVLLQEEYNEGVGGDEVVAAEASAGSVESWIVGLRNDSGIGLSNLRVWLDAATAGLEISWDGASWVTPTTETHVDVLIHPDLAAGATKNLYIRRTIGAASPADPAVLNLLQFAWSGL